MDADFVHGVNGRRCRQEILGDEEERAMVLGDF